MNTIKISKWMAGTMAAMAVSTAGNGFAKDILLVDAGQTPDPRQVAAVLGRVQGEPIKLRGIRVLNSAGNVAAAQAGTSAVRVDCPPAAPTRPSTFKVRGVRLPADSRAAEPAAVVAQNDAVSADCVQAEQEHPISPAAVALAGPAVGHTPESIALMVPFRFNSAQIADDAIAQLDAMAEGIKLAGPDVRLIIEGHTDAAGTDQYNLILSYLRASAVRDYLVREHGLSPRNLKPVGMGKRAPLNAANPGAPENRRVEFRVEQS